MIEALLVNAGVLLAATLVMWAIAVKIHDASIVDSYWGGGMALMAAVSWLQLAEPGVAANVLALMAIVWGMRLALHILTRWLKEGEDQRYKRIMRKARENGTFAFTALTKVFLGQAVLLFAVCSPAQVVFLGKDRLDAGTRDAEFGRELAAVDFLAAPLHHLHGGAHHAAAFLEDVLLTHRSPP